MTGAVRVQFSIYAKNYPLKRDSKPALPPEPPNPHLNLPLTVMQPTMTSVKATRAAPQERKSEKPPRSLSETAEIENLSAAP